MRAYLGDLKRKILLKLRKVGGGQVDGPTFKYKQTGWFRTSLSRELRAHGFKVKIFNSNVLSTKLYLAKLNLYFIKVLSFECLS